MLHRPVWAQGGTVLRLFKGGQVWCLELDGYMSCLFKFVKDTCEKLWSKEKHVVLNSEV